MRPLLKYPGGKQRELRHIMPYIPEQYDRYIEPFLGGGSVYFELAPSHAVLTDVVASLINFYTTVRDNFGQLREQLDSVQAVFAENQKEYEQARLEADPKDGRVPNRNESLYYYMRDILNGKIEDSNVLPAVAYFVVNKLAYAGQVRYNSSGDFNIPFGHYTNLNTSIVSEEYSTLLQSADLLECTDYHKAFELAQPDDFMFLDPPYDSVFRKFKAGTPFTEDDHRELADAYHLLQCKALMVINKTPLTMELYGDQVIEEYAYTYNSNIKNRYNRYSQHIIVANYL